MANLKRERSPQFATENHIKRPRTMFTSSPQTVPPVPSRPSRPDNTPIFTMHSQHPSPAASLIEPRAAEFATAGTTIHANRSPAGASIVLHEEIQAISNQGGEQINIVTKTEEETVTSFLERVRAAFTDSQLQHFLMSTSRQTLKVPVHEEQIDEFLDMVYDEAEDSWVDNERNPYDTEDVDSGRVRRNVVGVSITTLQSQFKRFILREATTYNIIRGRWEFFVKFNQASEVYEALVRRFESEGSELFVEAEYWGDLRGVIIAVWTENFNDKQTIEEVSTQIRAAPGMGKVKSSMRYRPEVFFNTLLLHDKNDWGVRTALHKVKISRNA